MTEARDDPVARPDLAARPTTPLHTRAARGRSTYPVAAVLTEPSHSALQLSPVVAAARSAVQPPGHVRWTADRHVDHVDLRLVVRRRSTGVETAARLARLACGAALRAARLAVAVQGRQPVVSCPDQPGLMAVLQAGRAVAPRHEEEVLYSVLRDTFVPPLLRCPSRTAVLQRLRRSAEVDGAWLRVLTAVPCPSPALGPSWHELDEGAWTAPGPDTAAVLVGARGPVPAVDLRVGQAVEAVRLTATALGLAVRVLAAPATPAALGIRSLEDGGADVLAVVQVRWPLADGW
jgi:hypothetical protein